MRNAEAPTADGDQGGQRRKKTTKERKEERTQVTTHVGTWNLQGKISNAAQRETLSKDMQSTRKISIERYSRRLGAK